MTRQTATVVLVGLAGIVLLPLLWMIAMGGGMMGGMSMGGMMGMAGFGLLWILLAAAVIIAFIVLIVRAITRT